MNYVKRMLETVYLRDHDQESRLKTKAEFLAYIQRQEERELQRYDAKFFAKYPESHYLGPWDSGEEKVLDNGDVV